MDTVQKCQNKTIMLRCYIKISLTIYIGLASTFRSISIYTKIYTIFIYLFYYRLSYSLVTVFTPLEI